MSHRQTVSTSSPTKGFHLGLQPAQAWLAILTLTLFSALCLLVHASSILNIAFPAGSFAVGAFLYWRYPVLYLGFTWWVWFLSPFISRLVEYQNGWTDSGLRLIIVSPYLVTMLTCVSFFRHLPRMYQQDGLPFVLAFIGVFYSFLVGLVKNYPLTEIIQALLSWLPAIFFGFHLLVNWRDYPSYRQNTQRTFCWGVLVLGVYGVVQYLVAPEWDRFWLKNSEELLFCCGWPEPLMIRVWSTSNTPATFASVMVAGLLLLFSSQEALRVPAAVAGYLAFLLSVVRAAWGSWFVGLLTLITSVKPALQMRLLITIFVMGVCLYPLTSIDPFSEIINSRLQSFSNITEDHSLSERSELYAGHLDSALSEGLGKGLGGGKLVDAGILEILSSLGWFGTIPYVGGIILLFFNLFQYTEVRFDFFMNAARAISFSIFIMLPATNTMVLLHGMLFWGFSGIAVAAHKYYQHQHTTKLNRSSAT